MDRPQQDGGGRGGGNVKVVQHGLRALLLGVLSVMLAVALLTPTIGGLAGLPDHILQKEAEERRKRVATKPKLTMAQQAAIRRNVVRLINQEVGVREWPTRANHSARIVTYRRAVKGVGENPYAAEPWCADFTSWAWMKVGQPIGFRGLGSDYVPELTAWAKISGKWRKPRKGYRPLPGDLVVYQANGMRYGHIGVVVSVKNGAMRTVEGNYADKVSRRTMKVWDSSISGFIRPI